MTKLTLSRQRLQLSSVANGTLLCFASFLFIPLCSATQRNCKSALSPNRPFQYQHYTRGDIHNRQTNAESFRVRNSNSGLVFGVHSKLRALHILNPQQRFLGNAPLHAVIFDKFGFSNNDFSSAENKIKTLYQKHDSQDLIQMGAEAYSPTEQLNSAEAVASWMESILDSVNSQKPDQRALVIYVKGGLSEGAAILAQKRPDLVSSLIFESPIRGDNPLGFPKWNQDTFKIPTFIVSGTHDNSYSVALRQKAFDFSKQLRLNHKTSGTQNTAHLHYLDIPFANQDIFASSPHQIAHREIHRFLHKHVLKTQDPDFEATSPEEFIRIAQTQGIGLRRFFGHKPKPTPENEINAIRSGVLMWECGLKAVKSIEEAFAHVEKLSQVKEKPANATINRPLFFISNSPFVDSLNQTHSLEAALSHFGGSAPHQLLDDAISAGNKFFSIDENGHVIEFHPDQLSGVPIEAVYAGDNKNGFIFNLSGWTLPVIRGVIDIKRAKETSSYKNGRNYFHGPRDRKGNLTNPGLVAEGYYFAKNKNFFGVLEKLRNMHRKGQSENATRFLDPYNIVLMQRLYESNLLDTIELYDAQGNLVAGGLVVKIDNVWSPETIFYPHTVGLSAEEVKSINEAAAQDKSGQTPRVKTSQTLDGIDFGKVVISHMIDEAEALGYTELDSQIASSLTVMYGARYESTDEHFLPYLSRVNSGWEEMQKIRAAEKEERKSKLAARFKEAQAQIDALTREIQALKAKYLALKEVSDRIQAEFKSNRLSDEEAKNLNDDQRAAIAARREARKVANNETKEAFNKLEEKKRELETLRNQLINN